MKKFLKWLKSPASDFALFIILLILANLAAHNAFIRFDLTGPKSYSLSKASKSVVKTIEEPLNVRVFFADNLTAPYNTVAQYVKDILVEYKGAANKNFSVSYMDMSKPENEKIAREYGLQQIQIQEVKNNEVGLKQVYMGIVVSYGDNIETLDGITSADGFEYNLTTKISKMISTADSLASLAAGDKITLTLYLSERLKALRINGTDQAEEILRNAVASLNKKNMDRLEFKLESPEGNQAADLAEKYGLPKLNVQNADGSTESMILGAVLQHGEQFAVLPVQVQRSLFGYAVAGLEDIEADVAASLQTLLLKTTKIGYITGHGELPLTASQNPYGQQDLMNAANFKTLISDLYEFSELDLSKDDIPVGMGSIIINGPTSDYSELELYKIDQFIMKGGNLLCFADGVKIAGQDYYGNPTCAPITLNIDRLLEKYGIKRNLNVVMDKNCYTQMSQQYGKMNRYWIPVLQKSSLAKRNVITSNLGYVIMLMNGSIDLSAAEADKNVKATVLAKTSPDSWTMDQNIVLNSMMINPPADPKSRKAENIAVMVEGKFQSAFDKAVEADVAAENEVAGGKSGKAESLNVTSDNHLANSVQNGKIIFISSSQVTTEQLIGTNASNPIAMLLLNCVDYLNGNEDLCSMRTKGLSVNTLNVKSQAAANLAKYFNQAGLAVLVALAGFIVWRKRTERRNRINEKYNPGDDRRIKK